MRAWVLNIDAEDEFAAGRIYRPKQRALDLIRSKRELLIGSLVHEGDVILDADTPAEQVAQAHKEGAQVHLWSPTPNALKCARGWGFKTPSAPNLNVLRLVNQRSFAARVHASLTAGEAGPEGALTKRVVCDLEAARAQLAKPADFGWLVRRPFGAAGRGRRRLYSGRPEGPDLAWLRASLELGPLVIEPMVRIEQEFTRSGTVSASGQVTAKGPCWQTADAGGAWTSSVAAVSSDVQSKFDAQLEGAFFEAGRELARAGYFGAFGIDAFTYRTQSNTGSRRVAFNPLSEINARLTMDWSQAGASVEDLQERRS